MSAEMKAVLGEAIAAHPDDEQDGAIPTGYALRAKGRGVAVEDSDLTCMLRAIAEGRDYITTLGLVGWMRVVAQNIALEGWPSEG
ncbi:hypothetical protein ACIQUC_16270 [Curtobacterium sp. NPDC098951]|uniref:hypothetical protein n=1 Tax=Curtobacterium sp. NPDC098951 TaxID=3363974 RepID=UPI00380C8FBB